MKEGLKKSRKGAYAHDVNEKSIETAVRYLIEECLRLNDLKGAEILQNALIEYKNKNEIQKFPKNYEAKVIHFLKEFLKLNDEQKGLVLSYFERKAIEGENFH